MSRSPSNKNLFMIVHDDEEPQSLTDKWLILDYDETLAHTFDESKRYHSLISKEPSLIDLKKRSYHFGLVDESTDPNKPNKSKAIIDIYGITRPGLEDFLIFAFEYFKGVAIWSAGTYDYVNSVCYSMFRDLDPHIIFTQNDCSTLEDNTIIKPIDKMIERMKSFGMKHENTFIVDDREKTFSNNKDNGILIPAYDPEIKSKNKARMINALRKEDNNLYKLINFFKNPLVMNAKDVRLLDKSKIFTTDYVPNVKYPYVIDDNNRYKADDTEEYIDDSDETDNNQEDDQDFDEEKSDSAENFSNDSD